MSEVRTITFKVDTATMFNAIHAMGGDFGPVGERLASCLLGGSDWFAAVGLAHYGIDIVDEALEPSLTKGSEPHAD